MILPFLAILGVVTGVHDGDTLKLADGTRIRLQGIDANELDGFCHVACAIRSAIEARDSLSRLALGHQVSCEPTGTSYRRVTAWCSVGGADLSCAQVRGSYAVRWDRYDPRGRLVRCEQQQSIAGYITEQMGKRK